MSRLRVGLIGVGKHGLRYAHHIRSDLAEEVELAGIARRDWEKARAQAEHFGCRAFRDYRELIRAAEVEAVIAVVPPTLHGDICAAVAAAGKPMLLEKPAASSLVMARQMLAAVRDHPVPIMVAQTLRYNSVVQALARAREHIGPIHAVRLSQRFEPSPLGWIDEPEKAGGGMLLHTGVHSFDLLRFLTGAEVERVCCETARVVTSATEDNFVVAARLEGGILASVAGSRATRSRTGPIEIAGAGGLLRGDHVLGMACLVTDTSTCPLPVDPPVPTVREVVRDFARAVRAGDPMPVPLIEGLRAVAVVDACYRSAAEGRCVPVPELA